MKRKSLSVSSFALASILLLSVGCMKRLDDAKMSSDIQNKFSQDSGLANKQLTVQANDGVVTLSGSVENASQRDAAGRQAASVSGVKTVINNLQIGDTSAAMSPAPQATTPSSTPAPQVATDAPPAEKPDPGMDMRSHKPRPRGRRRSHRKSRRRVQRATSSRWLRMIRMPAPSDSSQPPADNSAMSTAAPTPAPPPPPPPPKKFIVDQGTQLTVRLVDPIDSEKNQTGDGFHATLNAPITSDGEEAIPAGTEIRGHLVSVKSAGKFAGQSEVVMQLDSVSSGGTNV